MKKFNNELDDLRNATRELDWDGAGARPTSTVAARLARSLVAAIGKIPDGVFPHAQTQQESGFTLEYGDSDSKGPLLVFHITDKIEIELLDKKQRDFVVLYSSLENNE